MPKGNLQQHLDEGMHGIPLIKPDEQHRYMGTFRERCYLTMTLTQMEKPENQLNLLKELQKHPNVTSLLNGKMSPDLQNTYIKLINKNNNHFTIINDFVENKPDAFGLIVTANEAVNEPIIDIEKKYPLNSQKKSGNKPKGFWHKLFG
ncbi:YueI family protein [Melissococcus plutonius]|uniref:DUF1694 domain-containing protein n=1 Tax=Melissococcus plutonius (strain ATCC 35311 / DSM 29964 / CIP 104052 / LMG 20360 / NCIMB 702443) TaxID=940190 RepID=F3Y8G6_MELPT|nr:YueI family protein [Melissococcus plutonius]KMT30768.1 hypothetical protein MEPL6_6c03110 [Melissococcus plutonius]KMT35393.1 hypothetical protein MEPL8_2c01070 [Melissococcus plutonius]KMT41131.1 hypothetical protein MEPL12_1c03110 [Melissococcus plutonius]MBB5177960.1 uncharacterized protein YueI [Melissococcus plutonius]BAK20794.1 conserved hypothetical protein [Melissococcus plutonius ATCC 35311]